MLWLESIHLATATYMQCSRYRRSCPGGCDPSHGPCCFWALCIPSRHIHPFFLPCLTLDSIPCALHGLPSPSLWLILLLLLLVPMANLSAGMQGHPSAVPHAAASPQSQRADIALLHTPEVSCASTAGSGPGPLARAARPGSFRAVSTTPTSAPVSSVVAADAARGEGGSVTLRQRVTQ